MRYFTSSGSFKSKSVKKIAGVAAALMILPVTVACSTTSDEVATSTAPDISAAVEEDTTATDPTELTAAGETVVDLAMADGSFSTLLAAVESAGLMDELKGDGEYTVFAPTDEAFEKLPEGTLEKLLLPENASVLMEVLSYHVVTGKVPSVDIQSGSIPTIGGEALTIAIEEGGVKVNEATVVMPDAIASNGVIHAIDTVLLPSSLDLSTL